MFSGLGFHNPLVKGELGRLGAFLQEAQQEARVERAAERMTDVLDSDNPTQSSSSTSSLLFDAS
jgi:hypothetical protein